MIKRKETTVEKLSKDFVKNGTQEDKHISHKENKNKNMRIFKEK